MKGLDSAMKRTGNQGAPHGGVSLQVRLRWYSRRWSRTLGWPGMLAIGLLVACPLWYFSSVRPMQDRLGEARRSVTLMSERGQAGNQAAKDSSLTPAEQLAEFYSAFPAERYSPQWLEKLIAVADQNDLNLNEGDYKTSREKVGRLVRYQITLPVKGQYPQIREFLAEIPAEIPIMALENVQFERENIADATVTARIRLVLYLEQAS
ncbi:MAG TPA: type 4a pilus biogenesis protein PilO [Gallionella sp.]|nr:type 4a pilus biogenesis protein PilO [Gallionella sp.]